MAENQGCSKGFSIGVAIAAFVAGLATLIPGIVMAATHGESGIGFGPALIAGAVAPLAMGGLSLERGFAPNAVFDIILWVTGAVAVVACGILIGVGYATM